VSKRGGDNGRSLGLRLSEIGVKNVDVVFGGGVAFLGEGKVIEYFINRH
jgi:hypothetical protein